MARKIANLNKGVRVRIAPDNSRAIARIIIRTGRSFAKEIDFALRDYIAAQSIPQTGDGNALSNT